MADALPFRPRRFSRLAVLLLSLLEPVHAWSAEPGEYRLSVGDVVSFDFLDDLLPAQQLTVANDGQVTIPLLGSFKVEGSAASEAADAIRAAFVAKDLIREPQIAFEVVGFRPIFVLGDVRLPGSYAFQSRLTVEQAVALAGGQSAGGATAEDRVVTQARLRGDLEEASVGLAREAVAAARLRAQIDGRSNVGADDLPANAREYVSAALLSTLLPTQQSILDVERNGFETRNTQLTAAVGEVGGALKNLEQLAENQKAAIASAREDLERNRGLYKRGIKTLTDMASIERDVVAQESHLLEIYNQMSTTRRELGDLQRQLSDATDLRAKTALLELQDSYAAIETLLASRRSKEQQMVLLSSLTAEQLKADSSIVFAYRMRRRIDGVMQTQTVGLLDAVEPGDTVLVSIEPVGTERSASIAEIASATEARP